MNKKIVFLMIGLVLLCTIGLSAKSVGIELDVGGIYTWHLHHDIGNGRDTAGFSYHNIKNKHLGGFNVGINYPLPKNWALFATTMFAFNRTFVNDTQIGIGYDFAVGKGFKLFLGGAFAMGGSISTYVDKSEHYFNIGGGLSLIASHSISSKLGIYFGISNSYYKPITGKIIRGKTEQKLDSNNLRNKMHQSFNVRVGLRIKL